MLHKDQVVKILQICEGMKTDDLIHIFAEPVDDAVSPEDYFDVLFTKAIQLRKQKKKRSTSEPLPTSPELKRPKSNYTHVLISWVLYQRLVKEISWGDIENYLHQHGYDVCLRTLQTYQMRWYKHHGWNNKTPHTEEFLAKASQESILKWLQNY